MSRCRRQPSSSFECSTSTFFFHTLKPLKTFHSLISLGFFISVFHTIYYFRLLCLFISHLFFSRRHPSFTWGYAHEKFSVQFFLLPSLLCWMNSCVVSCSTFLIHHKIVYGFQCSCQSSYITDKFSREKRPWMAWRLCRQARRLFRATLKAPRELFCVYFQSWLCPSTAPSSGVRKWKM